MFYDKYLKLCQEHGEKPYSVSRSIGLGNSNVAQWKKGSTPRPDVISKIANYFSVGVEYFLSDKDGEETKKEAHPPEGGELTELQKEAVDFILSLSSEQLQQFVNFGKSMKNE